MMICLENFETDELMIKNINENYKQMENNLFI